MERPELVMTFLAVLGPPLIDLHAMHTSEKPLEL